MEPQSSPIPSRVCITRQCEDNEYKLFIVDVDVDANDDEFELAPTIRLIGFEAAYCLFGSTLYVFDGCHDNSKSKFIHSFELPSNISESDLVLEKSMLKKVCSMKGYKYYPVATLLPAGDKILVFSSKVTSPDSKCQFELFDPVEQRCQKLPELFPLYCRRTRIGLGSYNPSCEILLFSFIGKSILFVQTNDSKYTLDLIEVETWKVSSFFSGASFVEDPIQVVGEKDDICLTPRWAYDIDTEDHPFTWVYGFPELSSLSECDLLPPDVILLDISDPRYCKFCIFQNGLEETRSGSFIPHMVLDVYQCDLVECRKQLTLLRPLLNKESLWEPILWSTPALLLPHTKKLKTFKFCLEPQLSDWFHILSVYSFPAATISRAKPPSTVSCVEEGRRRSARLKVGKEGEDHLDSRQEAGRKQEGSRRSSREGSMKEGEDHLDLRQEAGMK